MMTEIKRVILDTTSRCNLQCPMCWGPPRTFDSVKNEYIDTELSLSDTKKILEFMKDNFRSSVLTINGGEPLMDDNIVEVLKMAKKLGYSTTLSTNAVLFKDHLDILKYLDAIAIPIDSITEKTSSIMRSPIKDHHDISLEAIKIINDSGTEMHIKVGTVVTGLNIHEVIEIGDEMRKRKLKVDTRKLFQYKPVGHRKNHSLRDKLLVSREDFDKMLEQAKEKFPEFHVHGQSNEENGLYILVRPDGSVTVQEDRDGNINPDLGNILTDDKKVIVKNLEHAVDPVAERKNAKKSYNL